jgi:hypothetical protein
MQKDHSQDTGPDSKKSTDSSNHRMVSLNAEKHHYREGEEPAGSRYYPEDEADRLLRVTWRWLSIKLLEASLLDMITSIATVILVIVGIWGACIYEGQLQEMGRATQATRDAVTVASNIQRATQRPYVASDGIHLHGPDRNGTYQIEQLWRNYGQTTAVNMTIRYEIGGALPSDWKHTFSPSHHELRSDLVGGSDTNAFDSIDATFLANQDSPGATTYIWGRIDYQDVFDGLSPNRAVPHLAEYCLELKDLTSAPGKNLDSPRNYEWGYVQGCGVDHPGGGTCFDQGCKGSNILTSTIGGDCC